MSRILVVDDEQNIRKVIREYCEFKDFQVTEAADGMEAVQLCRTQDFDVIVMDIMLPRLNGFSACQEILREKYIPIIMVSARDEEYDKLFGFELGIEDYLVKPFSPMELMARINVVLRRNMRAGAYPHAVPKTSAKKFCFRGLEVDEEKRTMTVDGSQVYLPAKAMDLLVYLLEHRNELISRERLMQDVWGYTFVGNDRTIDTHVKLLRSGLGAYREMLVTLRNRGYRLEVPEEE